MPSARGATGLPDSQPFVDRLADAGSRFGLLVVWLASIGVFSVLRPTTFFTTENLQITLGSQAILLILTLAVLVPLTAGEFDLSIAGVLGVSLVLVGYLHINHGWPIGAAVAVAVATGVAVGALNAFLIVGIGVDSIIVTLGTGTMLLGASLGINNETVSGISEGLVTAVRHQVFGVQIVFLYGVIATIATWYVFRYTPLGRYIFFVGAGREVARLCGIRVNFIRTGALLTSSTVSAIAGVLLAGFLGAADPNVGASYLLPAFAGAFLGSTAVTPGRFNAWGTFIAVYFLATGITGLQLLGFTGWIEQVFYGASLVVAVTLSRLAATRLEA